MLYFLFLVLGPLWQLFQEVLLLLKAEAASPDELGQCFLVVWFEACPMGFFLISTRRAVKSARQIEQGCISEAQFKFQRHERKSTLYVDFSK